jgi:hypothetical protein
MWNRSRYRRFNKCCVRSFPIGSNRVEFHGATLIVSINPILDSVYVAHACKCTGLSRVNAPLAHGLSVGFVCA